MDRPTHLTVTSACALNRRSRQRSYHVASTHISRTKCYSVFANPSRTPSLCHIRAYLYLPSIFLIYATYCFCASSGLISFFFSHALYFALPCQAIVSRPALQVTGTA